MVSVSLSPKLAVGSASHSRQGESTLEHDRDSAEKGRGMTAGGRARLQAGTGLQNGKAVHHPRPLGENLRFPQWWARKPFYWDIKEKGTFEGFGQAQDHRRILWFSACPNRRLPCLQLCQVSSLIHSEASLPLPGTIPDRSLGQFHRFLPSSYFNLLSAVKACVQPPAFAQMEAGNQEGRRLAKIAPKRGPGGRE